MENAAPAQTPTRFRLGIATRVVKGLGQGSILLLLALPFVALANCSGAVVEYSGYQALAGVSFPAAQFQIPQDQYPDFGHDWWIAGIVLFALIGVASAWFGGVKGAFVGLGASVAGFLATQFALQFFDPPETARNWSTEAANGGAAIVLVYFASVGLDLTWMVGKSWSMVGRRRGAGNPDRGDWVALGLFSGAFLVLYGLVLLAGVALLVVLRTETNG